MGTCCVPKNKRFGHSLNQKISQATRLNYISLRDQDLKSVPNQLNSLNIKTIDLGNNAIKNFHCSLNLMDKLQVLILDRNKISSLSQFSSRTLKTLNLNENSLQNLLEFDFPDLRKLFINSNSLVSLDFLVNCSQLEQLEVKSNQLSSLPEFLCELKELARVNFSANRIEELGIHWKPSKLLTIDLTSNRVSRVPESMLLNTNLYHIKLIENLVTPEAFMKTAGVQEYLNRRKTHFDKGLWEGLSAAQHILE